MPSRGCDFNLFFSSCDKSCEAISSALCVVNRVQVLSDITCQPEMQILAYKQAGVAAMDPFTSRMMGYNDRLWTVCKCSTSGAAACAVFYKYCI